MDASFLSECNPKRLKKCKLCHTHKGVLRWETTRTLDIVFTAENQTMTETEPKNLHRISDELLNNAIGAVVDLRCQTGDILSPIYQTECLLMFEWKQRFPGTIPPCLAARPKPKCYRGPTQTVDLSKKQ
jgi:hypothetical protein